MSTSSDRVSNDSPKASRDEAAVRLIHELGASLGVDVDSTLSREAIRENPGLEPLEALQRAAARSDLLLTPQRMRVSDVAWIADSAMPIVAWSESGREWLAVYRHGYFRARVWRSSSPEEGASTISRSELAAKLDQYLGIFSRSAPRRDLDDRTGPHRAEIGDPSPQLTERWRARKIVVRHDAPDPAAELAHKLYLGGVPLGIEIDETRRGRQRPPHLPSGPFRTHHDFTGPPAIEEH